MAMHLSTLLNGVDYRIIKGDLNARVVSVENDSRKVSKDSLFVAVIGAVCDGHDYIFRAMEQGASCVVVSKERKGLSDEEIIKESASYNTTVIEMEDTRIAVAILCAQLYGHPEDRLNLVGITGTKGKTTTAFMIHDILKLDENKMGLIGTVCNIINGEKRKTERTTPEALDIYTLMDEMARKKVDSCVMEVSSHGLKFNRVYGLRFDIGCFTNFFEDHIGPNDHPDLDDYFNSKLKLFDSSRIAVVNSDCNKADEVFAYASKRCTVYTYGLSEKSDCYATNIDICRRNGRVGTRFDLVSPWYEGEVFISLPGKFNVYNALCAICAAGVLKVDFEIVKEALANVFVPGRLQPVPNNFGIACLVDYAHNAASLQSVLESLRPYAEGEIITVFGCGGNRSKVRRPEMGEVSGKYSDYTIITSDNPRDEEPDEIIKDIVEGMKKTNGRYEVDPDRTSAIRKALHRAKKGDFVLIAGKGHEDYQEFENGRKEYYEDAVVAKELIAEMEDNL
ncbi:MAG: UDP-N-acetylmuramoyl-L-alanyl-D-glutamate--2,6-diaminopimelate ligase [Clostridiales bacterium]|nr:UDP-N-acetylmuramoyl-L-alanyl-D-glutamate--2,6-diaminopimelate ligase [Clostridiales bacterium]